MGEDILLEKLRLVEDLLREVTVPGFDIDVISSGVVSRFRISKDGRRIIVYLNFSSSDPGCPFCKFINHTLWTTIARNIRDVLISNSLFDEVFVVDELTKSPLT
ncbi:MAG: iron-sulfur cluster assembly protein [Desulfurococcaceae archaeon]|nr:iron-sulfur cluster assembly protein [Desulfurococcaceae archaeon]